MLLAGQQQEYPDCKDKNTFDSSPKGFFGPGQLGITVEK